MLCCIRVEDAANYGRRVIGLAAHKTGAKHWQVKGFFTVHTSNTDFIMAGIFSFWGFVLYSGIPPSIASVILVLTASCTSVRKYVHKGIQSVCLFDFFGRFFPIIHFFIAAEGFILAYLINGVINYESPSKTDIGQALGVKCKFEWRNQRNCYATAWAFTAWWYATCCISIFSQPILL